MRRILKNDPPSKNDLGPAKREVCPAILTDIRQMAAGQIASFRHCYVSSKPNSSRRAVDDIAI
jgi:hypothetical protein